MFSAIPKIASRLSPHLRRVLIVDQQPNNARVLAELVRDLCLPEIWVAESAAKALKLAAKIDPNLVFCETSQDGLDGAAFTRALRRSDLACRKAPVILLTVKATASSILAGRDAGAHEFLRRPYAMRDLQRRLEASLLHPRDWVEGVDYVGPDRRRFNSADYPGPLRRAADHQLATQGARVDQALKLIRSAVAAIPADPAQAERSLLAQVAELQLAVADTGDKRLAAGVSLLNRYLSDARGQLSAEQARLAASTLLAYVGDDLRATA